MSDYDRIRILGTGAIGSALAALLAETGRARASLVGSQAHWRAVRAHGLSLSIAGSAVRLIQVETLTLDELPILGARDLVLLTGKLLGLERMVAGLRPKLGSATPVIVLQNGLGVREHAARLLGRPVDRGLVMFGAYVPEPGRVDLFPGRIRFARSPAGEAARGLLDGPVVSCDLIDDLVTQEWRKLAINCLANPLAGLLGTNNARIGQADLDPAKEAILAEVRAVAAADGVALTLTVADFNRYMAGPTGQNIPSMRADILRGEPTEIDFINGAVVAGGARRGIPTPANALIVSLIKALEGTRAVGGRC
jgi:2-dehydropantoate 2-reductase